ncbi:MAG: S8 family serine peptidase [Bacteroidetes bacterium]|nr:S8 family serine peptidase [Bacteroidota bacterium]
MKNFYLLTIVCCFLSNILPAQQPVKLIQLKNGFIDGNKNLLRKKITSQSFKESRFRGKYFVLIQFQQLPGNNEKAELASRGVSLFDYIPGNAFLAEIRDSSIFHDLTRYHVSGVFGFPSQYKISSRLLQNQPGPDLRSSIAVTFFGTADKESVIEELQRAGAQIFFTKIQPANVIFIKASATVIQKISALPFVSYISPQSLQDVPLNNNNRAIHGVDALSAFSGRNLQGKNVTLGIGDNSDPSSHIDFAGRLIQRNATTVNLHGTHTTGTMAGGGILNPRYQGMAPKARIVSQYFSDIIVNTPVYINDYNMVLTNNSYYTGFDFCPGDGDYDAVSNYGDVQLIQNPTLLHVFAAGNDGGLTCSPYPSHFGTIKSGFQSGKNTLVVGNISNSTYTINASSSKGPVNDGRIKPEVTAGGVLITSTYPNNAYGTSSGTSMSAPTVTGTLGLLYERYRQLHGGADPAAALIKAIVCNGADDLGNPGPDFTYGFGMLNARNAVEMMERNQYFSGSISAGGNNTYTISAVPAGIRQLKIMLYWPDAPAAAFAPAALVNNLDLNVVTPGGTTHLPLILDPSPANVNNNAIEGIDNLNNIEQVVIDNPPAGDFTIHVAGANIPQGPQQYIVAYQIVNAAITVEYPFGNETLVPGEIENIRWSAYDNSANSFTVEYSADNGASWNLINNNVSSTSRSYAWTVPAIASNNALIRVTRNGGGSSDVSDYDFTILGQPTITVSNPCKGYAQIDWNAIPSATQYEIMMLKGDSMQTIATTPSTTFLLPGLNKDSSYWLSVRAINGGVAGRRAIAGNIIPNTGACSLPVFNNDFTVDSLLAPVTGRIFTSTQLGNTTLQVVLRNLGSIASAGSFNVSYQINNGAIVTETSAVSIAGGASYNYSFSNANNYDFSAPGTYKVKVWIGYPGDPQPLNDTITQTIKQLRNDPLVLNPNYTEGFESAAAQSYTTKTFGLQGLDRFDFNNSSSNGRANTFINTGFARTGNRCATLDQVRNNGTYSADSLIGTFNLSNYTSTDHIWLDFYYKNQGIDFNVPGNAVWIRGNDQSAWIPVDTMSIDPNYFGIYKASKNIDVSAVLANAVPAQTISSSFQIKFGEQGKTSANSVVPDGNLEDGFSFDDIVITKSDNDAGMIALLQPSFANICGLSNAETISAAVKNYTSTSLINVPITFAVNGDTITEIIPVIAANQTINYIFSQKADLSAYQHYDLRVWVSNPLDTYRNNDSLQTVSFQTTPLISAYPYLEGFENTNGYWYTQGINDNWQWGTPQKNIINKAANGSKAWVTNLTGNYDNNQLSYLYSPCFDLTSLNTPVLSFSHIFQMEDNCDCDYHWVEYSINDSTWTRLGNATSGVNWYDNALRQAWQKSDTIWHVSSFDIPVKPAKVRFRIVMFSDPASNFEGVGIDDIHIFDKSPVYDSANISTGISQNVSGSNWINFDMGGKRIASINPNGQDLGNTTVKVFIDSAAIRDTTNQYYLGRNIVIQPSKTPASDVSVRFYFLDSEVDSLINATGCLNCTSIHDAYQSGVTQYSSTIKTEEDSTLRNNVNGSYIFMTPQQQVHIIPYDNGYYAEYNVSGFSEFWINGGGPKQNLPLASMLQSFTATRIDTKGLLDWTTSQEKNTSRFVIQKSSDRANFSDIGTVPAIGNSDSLTNYTFTDKILWNGNNYYRLKIVFADGHFIYSPVRLILFDTDGFVVNIYPNPVHDNLYINTSVNCSQIVLFDASGKLVRSMNVFGFQNSVAVGNLARGVYIVVIKTDAGKKIQKIVVN